MGTTYLVRRDDGALMIATREQWLAIVRKEAGLPQEKRRCFIKDYICDGGNIDRLVIEVDYPTYLAWHREHMASERNRQRGARFPHLSMEQDRDGSGYPIAQRVHSPDTTEEKAMDAVIMEELREELSRWKPWGCDLLDAYLEGSKRSCTRKLALKYGVSEQTMRRSKRQFEKKIKIFFGDVSF